MKSAQQPLSNLQVEMLKLFSRQLSEEDLRAVKKLLADFFSKKAMDEADKIWEEKGWSEEDEKKFTEGHDRTPYRSE
ncbi:MAG: hypothetical protein POELPBGB_03705 [Bacteroidia bacterium]|nr:hypothetical protein [Bacteroidia bacterium]